MKHSLLLTGLAAAVLLSGCASTPSQPDTSAPAPAAPTSAPASTGENRGTRGEWNETPSVGMTRAQVLERYGDPRKIVQTAKGEVWHYRARTRGRDFVPVYGAFTAQRKGGTIGFDAHGRVSAYDWGTTRWGTWW